MKYLRPLRFARGGRSCFRSRYGVFSITGDSYRRRAPLGNFSERQHYRVRRNSSYWVHPSFRRRGIAPVAVQLTLRFPSDHTGTRCAHIMVDPNNTPTLATAASAVGATIGDEVGRHRAPCDRPMNSDLGGCRRAPEVACFVRPRCRTPGRGLGRGTPRNCPSRPTRATFVACRGSVVAVNVRRDVEMGRSRRSLIG